MAAIQVFALENDAFCPGRFPLVDKFEAVEVGGPREEGAVGDGGDSRLAGGEGRPEKKGGIFAEIQGTLDERREGIGCCSVGIEQQVVLPLQQRREVCKLDTRIRPPFLADHRSIVQRNVDEIPCMGMLGVDAAEATLELPSLDLQAAGQGGSYEIGFLQLRPAFRNGDVGVKVQIRVDRREDEQLRGFEGEPLVDSHGNVREPGDRSRIQFLLIQVRTVKERIDDQREIRIRHRGTAEDAGQFGGRSLLSRATGLRGFTRHRTCGCLGSAWSARSAERG